MALKFSPEAWRDDPVARKRFPREARFAAALHMVHRRLGGSPHFHLQMVRRHNARAERLNLDGFEFSGEIPSPHVGTGRAILEPPDGQVLFFLEYRR